LEANQTLDAEISSDLSSSKSSLPVDKTSFLEDGFKPKKINGDITLHE
jgi:hypothetical protein